MDYKMKRPIYLTFNEFLNQYPSDLELWKKSIPEGEEPYFLKQLLAEYNKYGEDFFKILSDTGFVVIEKGDIDFGDLDENQIKIVWNSFDSVFRNPNMLLNLSQPDLVEVEKIKVAFKLIKDWIINRIKEIENPSLLLNAQNINNKLDITKGWAKILLLIAKGVITKEHKGCNYSKLARELMVINAKNWLSQTIQETHEGERNAFLSIEKMQKIYNYCTINNVQISEWFASKLDDLRCKN